MYIGSNDWRHSSTRICFILMMLEIIELYNVCGLSKRLSKQQQQRLSETSFYFCFLLRSTIFLSTFFYISHFKANICFSMVLKLNSRFPFPFFWSNNRKFYMIKGREKKIWYFFQGSKTGNDIKLLIRGIRNLI